ncbi:MAG: NAD(+) kinase [Pseudomonadota bacterium]|nr:NAD(+) kinase [Pseudomonadota bacterium]
MQPRLPRISVAQEKFRNIGLIARSESEQALYSLRQLIHFLNGRDCTVILDKNIAGNLPEMGLQAASAAQMGEACDLVIVVGGDGSLLGAARTLSRFNVPVLGVNRGHLGFLTDILPSEIESRVGQVLDGDYTTEKRFLLDMEVRRGKTVVGEGCALNDVVLLSGDSVHMIDFELVIDGHFVYGQRSDGLIISTPTGSTAYALSCGGPIMHPKLDAMVMVPLNPHTLTSRPLVVAGDSEIKIHITTEKVRPLVSCDGTAGIRLQVDDVIAIRKRPHRLHLIHPPGHDFYQACRSKLGWSTRPGDSN